MWDPLSGQAGLCVSTGQSHNFSFVLCSQYINKYLVDELCVFDPTAKNVDINVQLVIKHIQGKVPPNNLKYIGGVGGEYSGLWEISSKNKWFLNWVYTKIKLFMSFLKGRIQSTICSAR